MDLIKRIWEYILDIADEHYEYRKSNLTNKGWY